MKYIFIPVLIMPFFISLPASMSAENSVPDNSHSIRRETVAEFMKTITGVSFKNITLADTLSQLDNSGRFRPKLKGLESLENSAVTIIAPSISIDDLYFHLFVPRRYTFHIAFLGVDVAPLDNADVKSGVGAVMLAARFPGVLEREAAIESALLEKNFPSDYSGLNFNELAAKFQSAGGCAVSLDPDVKAAGMTFDLKVMGKKTNLLGAMRSSLAANGLGAVVLHGALYVTKDKTVELLSKKLAAAKAVFAKPVKCDAAECTLGYLSNIVAASAGVEMIFTPNVDKIPPVSITINPDMNMSDLSRRVELQTGLKLITARTDKLDAIFILDAEVTVSAWEKRLARLPAEPKAEDLKKVKWELAGLDKAIEKANARTVEIQAKSSAHNLAVVKKMSDFQQRRSDLLAQGASQEEINRLFDEWRAESRADEEALSSLSNENQMLMGRLDEMQSERGLLDECAGYIERKLSAAAQGEVSRYDRIMIVMKDGVKFSGAVLIELDELFVTYELVGNHERMDMELVKEVRVLHGGAYVPVDPYTGKIVPPQKQ